MQQRLFKQVDVFTATPYFGNPVAVVHDASGLDDEAMQRFARWTNLSETCFLSAPTDPQADYRVRIFTPGGELPFAGHPTLGSCHSWLQAGGQPRRAEVIVQECGIGLIRIHRQALAASGQQLAFAAPPVKRSAIDPALLAEVAQALGLQDAQILAAQMLDNGPRWLALLLDSPETVLQLTPDHPALANLQVKVGVAAFYPPPETPPLIGRRNREARAFGQGPAPLLSDAPDLEVRAFAACIGIPEDPVTGSLNASLAQWLMAQGHAPERYRVSQGVCLGRAGQLHIERDASGQVWVGGESVTCVEGVVML